MTHKPLGVKHVTVISIHALRVEGDILGILASRSHVISIHALRVEGDFQGRISWWAACGISIHALRVEGDHCLPYPPSR